MSGRSVQLEVGAVYRFKGEQYFKEYGEWEATRVDGKLMYGISRGSYSTGREVAMAYNPHQNIGIDSDIVEVSGIIDETEAFFV